MKSGSTVCAATCFASDQGVMNVGYKALRIDPLKTKIHGTNGILDVSTCEVSLDEKYAILAVSEPRCVRRILNVGLETMCLL